jgi:hypothetical protein
MKRRAVELRWGHRGLVLDRRFPELGPDGDSNIEVLDQNRRFQELGPDGRFQDPEVLDQTEDSRSSVQTKILGPQGLGPNRRFQELSPNEDSRTPRSWTK